jgi:hypothetical protein
MARKAADFRGSATDHGIVGIRARGSRAAERVVDRSERRPAERRSVDRSERRAATAPVDRSRVMQPSHPWNTPENRAGLSSCRSGAGADKIGRMEREGARDD